MNEALTRPDRVVPFACFAASGTVYLLTLCPTVTFGDGPEVASAMARLGVAHPTGYPLFTLLGHVWGQVFAVGDLAWRYNALSAAIGALAVAVLGRALLRMTGCPFAAWTGAMGFALTPTFWAQCTELEVYSLHVFFLALTLDLWLRFEAGGERRWLYLLALCVGLSATHHAMTVLSAPWLAFALVTGDRSWLTVRRAALLVAAGVAPICLYLYLPVAAHHVPEQSWNLGPGAALGDYLAHMTGARFHASLDLSRAPDMLGRYGLGLLRTYSLLLGLAAIGLWHQRSMPRRLACLGLGYATALGFGLGYDVPDRDVFFLPSTLFVAVFVASGAAAIVGRSDARRVRCGMLVGCLPLLQLYLQLPQADRSLFYRPHDETLAALALVPPGGKFLGHDGAAPAYATSIARVRSDVEVVDIALDYRSMYPAELERLRAQPSSRARAQAVARALAESAGAAREVYLLPGRSDLAWAAAGLHRVERGVVDVLRLDPPRITVADVPAGLEAAALPGGLWLRGVECDPASLRQGDLVRLRYHWQLGPRQTPRSLEVVTLIAGSPDDAESHDASLRPLLVHVHRLGTGADLSSLPDGALVRDELFLQIPFEHPPGRWWVWVGVRPGRGQVTLPFQQSGRAYHRAARIRVEPGARRLWSLPRWASGSHLGGE